LKSRDLRSLAASPILASMASASDTVSSGRGAGDVPVIGLVSAGHFVSHVYLLLLPPLFDLIRGDYGLTYQQIAVAVTGFNVVSAALQTPAGFLVDRWGAERLLIGGLLLGPAALVVAALVPSYWALVGCYAVAGLANTVFHPSDYAILSHAVVSKRMGKAFSIHTFSGLLGTAAAPMTMWYAASLWSWRGSLLVAAALGLIVALALIVERRRLAVIPTRDRTARAAGDGDTGLRLLLTPAILRNLMFFMLLSLATGGIASFSIVALGALWGTSHAVATSALTAFLFLSALGVLLGGVIADRTRHHTRVAAMGFAASAAIILIVGIVDLGAALLIFLMSVAGLLNGVIQPSRDMIVRAVTPAGSFGKVFGFVTTGFNIGGVISPLLYAWFMDHGEPRGVFLAVVGITLLSLLTVSTTRTRRPVVAAE
jgi:MFS family permease